MELFHDDWCVLAWRGNRWLGDALNLDAYLNAQHIAVNFGRGHRPGIVELALADQHLSRNVAIWASRYHLVPEMVAGTDRIATAPRRLARRVSEGHDLRIYPLPLILPAIDEIVQWNRFHDADPGLGWLRDKLIKVVSNQAGAPGSDPGVSFLRRMSKRLLRSRNFDPDRSRIGMKYPLCH